MKSMDIFAMFFAIIMVFAAIAATAFMWVFAGGFWAAAGFALFLFILYLAFTYQSGPYSTDNRGLFNAFQQPPPDN